MGEDNGNLRTENVKLKNEIKQQKMNSYPDNEDENVCNIRLTKELHDMRREFTSFRKFIYDEISGIKNARISSSSSDGSVISSHEGDINTNLNEDRCVGNDHLMVSDIEEPIPMSVQNEKPRYGECNKTPVFPGTRLYNRSHISETVILCDSTVGKMTSQHLKYYINKEEENIIMKKYPGHTAKEINYYCDHPLGEIKPKQVIIIVGTNDLSKGYYEKNIDEMKILNDICSIAGKAKFYGAKNIFIASILQRRGYHYSDVISRINGKLMIGV